MGGNAIDEQSDDIDALGNEVRAAVANLYRRFRTLREDGDLGDAALFTLTKLLAGPFSLTELSDSERVTPSSMSQTVNRLTSAGLAERGRDANDGRRVLFSITDAGRDVALAARAQRHAWLNEQLRSLSTDEREALATAASVMKRLSAR
jgi:DNA-binding MarR family transcriptional regulator